MALTWLSRPVWVLVSLMLLLLSSVGAAPTDLFEVHGDGDRSFEEIEIGNMLVFWHQRTIDWAMVEKDYIVYQIEKSTGELLARKSHWRSDLPEALPHPLIAQAQAEALVKAEILSCSLYFISPESDVFPLDPAPENPCWVVRNTGGHGEYVVTVIDAVTGVILGYGVPPPNPGAFTMTGPISQYPAPCAGGWDTWVWNAVWWFDLMGYWIAPAMLPTKAEVQAHIQSTSTAMFYEIAHGGSSYFRNGCLGDDYETTTSLEIESWMAGYEKMPFAFIASCGGMCNTADGSFAYEFRKGSDENTTVVGYCGMDEPQCDNCWTYSKEWQSRLFQYMWQEYPVKVAFDMANADYPCCASAACMRFAGDEDFAVMPPVPRVYPPAPPANLRCGGAGDRWITWDHDGYNVGHFEVWEHDVTTNEWSLRASLLPNQPYYWCWTDGGSRDASHEYAFDVVAVNNYGSSPELKTDRLEGTCGGCPVGCPYVYNWAGRGFAEDNTVMIYDGGCGCPGTDHYKLEQPLQVNKDNRYVLQLREFENEHSYVDQVQLRTIDHDPDVHIAVDESGNVLPHVSIGSPVSCVDDNGQDQLAAILSEGGTAFHGYEGDWLLMHFEDVTAPETRLFLVARKKQLTDPRSIVVQKQTGAGWADLGQVHPRENWSGELVDISYLVPSDSLTLRLYWTAEHELDCVKLASPSHAPIEIRTCDLYSAMHSNGTNVRRQVARADSQYAEIVPTQHIEMQFTNPQPASHGVARDFIFASTGYFESIVPGRPGMNGQGDTVEGEGATPPIPTTFALSDPTPNPFDAATEIAYAVPRAEIVRVGIYNARQELVRQLVDGRHAAGYYRAAWDGTDGEGDRLPSGVYVCRMSAGEFSKSTQVVLLR